MNKLAEKPNIFKLMQVYEDRYTRLLSGLINNYDTMSAEEGLKKSKDVFDAIRLHLEREDSLIEDAEDNSELYRAVQSYKVQKAKIIDTLNEILYHHVNGPDYLEKLKQLRGQIRVLAELESTRLHKRLKRYVDPEALYRARERFLSQQSSIQRSL